MPPKVHLSVIVDLQACLCEVDPLLEELGLRFTTGGIVWYSLKVELHLSHQLWIPIRMPHPVSLASLFTSVNWSTYLAGHIITIGDVVLHINAQDKWSPAAMNMEIADTENSGREFFNADA